MPQQNFQHLASWCRRVFLSLTILATSVAQADEWPQWMGPTRDGVYQEAGILESFPKAGLKVRWRTPVAGGYSGPAVTKEFVLVTDYVRRKGETFNDPSKRAQSQGTERCLCLKAETGEIVWKDEYACNYSISYPAGPRCTPTVDGDVVYTLGAQGDLRCLNLADGKLIWQRNLSKEFGSKVPLWGHSAHPLVDGDRLICMVGGQGRAVVALDKKTGQEIWRSLNSSDAGYAPPCLIEFHGKTQLVVFHPEGVAGLDRETGKPFWQVSLKPQYEMSIARPQQVGNKLYASGIGSQSLMFEIGEDGRSAKELWRGESKSSVYAANATPIIHDGVIYGSDCGLGAFIAAKVEDGSRLWQTFDPTQPGTRRVSHGTAFVTRRNEQFWLFSETGDLILAELDPKGYHELGRYQVLKPTGEAFGRKVVWSHPAYAHQAAFCRNDEELVCVSIKAADYD